MLKSYKFRLYPTINQKKLIKKHIDDTRFVYNLALETKITAYSGNKVNLSKFDLIKQLGDLKKDLIWLKESNSQSLNESILNLDKAFQNFFKNANFPKFKSKHSKKQSFTIPQHVRLENHLLKIIKFPEGIKTKVHRKIDGKIKRATISITFTGKFFVSILVDNFKQLPDKCDFNKETAIGLDLGLKNLAILSNGVKIKNPRFLKKNLRKIKFLQRKYSKFKGKKTKRKLALQHEKITNKRRDFLHKESTKLISDNQTICVENLDIKKMMKKSEQIQKTFLNRSIFDVGWSMFISMLSYKAEWNGKNLKKIGRFEPSSKTCSICGFVNLNLTLEHREWQCSKCKTILDRDINAAINIKDFAFKKVCGTQTKNYDELPTLVGVKTHKNTMY